MVNCYNNESSHSELFWKKRRSQNLGKILKKHPQSSPFSSKATGLKPATLPKKSPSQAYPGPELFLLYFRISKTPIFQNTS